MPCDAYWLVDRQTGEGLTVDGDTVARVVGVEIEVVKWAIEHSGRFENGGWQVLDSELPEIDLS